MQTPVPPPGPPPPPPPRHELLDGTRVPRPPQPLFHMRAIRLLEWRLLAQAPAASDVLRQFAIALDERNHPEPDVLVTRPGVDMSAQQTHLDPQDVALAIEIVSEDTADRDREATRMYAAHGIRHFWRVEEGSEGLPVVYVHELDPATRAYVSTGIHRNRLKLAEPFAIDIDLTTIDRRR
ncbi:hypothetical protein ADK70_14235 [Streptomyces rimosus subsp. pseudoverticillatus]|uniref:Uma2 family endonuclease n=1 Tax=Streptomyces rimosus TaxID=1927 RepID=UPI0006C0C31B|nr:Uma2 family endonuclease [Streptomyces rimosus]KOT93264.1 hypothetical protein ADK70_14235 [Streptomyces rimosus subsp. pseudoverticillatus]